MPCDARKRRVTGRRLSHLRFRVLGPSQPVRIEQRELEQLIRFGLQCARDQIIG